MSENGSNSEGGGQPEAGEQQPAVLRLERVYVKDLSFESPNVPEMFTREDQPEANVELATEGRVVSDQGHIESVLTVTVRSTLEDKTVFIAEVQQAGLFRVVGVPQKDLEQLMGVNCPTILFPYAREAVSSLVARGGFQPVMLDPVNFQALYQQHQQQAETEGE